MSDEHRPAIRTDIPHSARIWNYWMGGKDYYEVDRVAGDAGIAVDPDITTMAIQSRQFLIRAVRFLAAECGIRQFLDLQPAAAGRDPRRFRRLGAGGARVRVHHSMASGQQ